MKGLRFSLLGLIVSLAACAPSGSQQSAELAAKADQLMEAMNAGDLDAVVNLYAEDARLLPPNAELMQGHDAIRSVCGEMIASGLEGDLATIEAVTVGDMDYRVGTFTSHIPDGTVVDRGKYIEVWQKRNGEWKIINDMFSSDLPVGYGTTTLAITHEVKDAEHWFAAWQGEGSRHELFAQHVAPRVRTFQDPDNPSVTGLVIDVVDMAAFQTFTTSPASESAKAENGVKDATLSVFAEVK
jgi:uncharacterized protein (TIGR02246 family)